MLADGLQSLHAAPVKLHTGTDAVCTAAEHYDGAVVACVVDVVGYSAICEIEIVGVSRIFGCQRIYLLHYRENAFLLSYSSDSH